MFTLDMFNVLNMPSAAGIWAAIASNFTNVAQAIYEFVDNAISNFRGNPVILGSPLHQVKIHVSNLGKHVKITIEDNGTGIKNLHNALTLAGTECQETPLNEHGFGLKHALAYMDGNDCEWTILTRTAEDVHFNRHVRVSGAYDFDGMKAYYEAGWPGELGTTGTIISFTCPMAVFETLDPDKKIKRNFEQLTDILGEHLRYTYADILQKGELVICLSSEDSGTVRNKYLTPLLPQWKDGTLEELPAQSFKLNGDMSEDEDCVESNVEDYVTIHCRYGTILPSGDNYCYYLGNMESSGVEIRINGRVIENGLFRDVWKRAPHNAYNRFLVQVDVRSDNPTALPSTKASKNGLRLEREEALALLEWIHMHVELPRQKKLEHELRHKLAEHLRKQEGVTYVEEEKVLFTSNGVNVPVDIYMVRNNKAYLYECKAHRTGSQHCYQLCMYWDGGVVDGLPVEEITLVAESHPFKVNALARVQNQLTGPDGRLRKIRLSTWAEEGIAA